MRILKNIIFLKSLIILIIFTLDRVSKTYIINLFNETQFNEIYLIKFININFIWNEGIAFGLLNFGNQLFYDLISSLIAIISLVILFLAFKNKNFSGYFFAMVFGGSIGNLYDRIKFSAVPDFIDLHYNNFHWFIFNIADIFITLGILCLIYDEVFLEKKRDEKNF
jgi:signal peptidase II